MKNHFHPLRNRWLRLAIMTACIIVMVVGIYQLGSYIYDLLVTRQNQRMMSASYHAALTTAPIPEEQLTKTESAEPVPEQQVSATEQPVSQSAEQTADDTLPNIVYPSNPYALHIGALAQLSQQYTDLRGWLQIDDQTDDAVMLRDNSYYLTRGVDGKENVNGALFLDAKTVFRQNYRPYTFIIYGHNMRTGAMFGSLKKYTEKSWYEKHPFITFNTLYEDGRYVVFSVLTINVRDENAVNYLPVYGLYSDRMIARAELLRTMKNRTHCSNAVDVRGDDQILLLITCNGDDAERLVVAARRIRAGESEEELQKLVR